jgi:hypothetical protein
MKRQFDETGHPCEPNDITSDAWFYTQQDGLIVCASGCPGCGKQRRSLLIPWRVVKRAVADHGKAKDRKP